MGTERVLALQEIDTMLRSLSPKAARAFVLSTACGMTHQEIAGELGMAVGSSKAQLHRARQLLRGRLGGEA